MYHISSRYTQTGYTDIPRLTPKRARFLVQALVDLRIGLSGRRGDLRVTDADLSEAMQQVIRSERIDAVFFHEEAGTEEESEADAVDRIARSMGIPVHRYRGATLVHPDDLPWDVSGVPDVFTPFRKHIERDFSVRDPLPPPQSLNRTGSVDCTEGTSSSAAIPSWFVEAAGQTATCDRTAFPFEGGESAARARVQSYLWDTGNIEGYKETRNGLVGTEYSSKLSPWLAIGALSARSVYSEVKRYEQTRVRNESTYWLVFELLWRDFYLCQMMKHGRRSFRLDGPFSKKRSWSFDPDAFEAWKQGRTGVPFVDAGMRELVETGYMSNRIRQNCASFLSNNLNIDWRYGAQWFEAHLLDYDVSSNWGNWAYNSRVGCDPRDRFFDVVGQGERYDRNAEFISLWIPELAHLSSRHRHRPWLSTEDTGRYPRPVIDLEASYERLRRDSRKS